MVEGEIGACSGPSGHNNSGLKGAYIYGLIDLPVSKTLLDVVPIRVVEVGRDCLDRFMDCTLRSGGRLVDWDVIFYDRLCSSNFMQSREK